ncbi:MAG: MerR family transcriptional regulator [Gemmatimonadaceae bacterium]
MRNTPEPESIDLLELSDKAHVSPRTIRYYIQQGLIPAPEARGPGAHYGPEHVDRLRLIKLLQREHLPLSEIRRRIEKLPPGEVRRILETEPGLKPTSASEYVQQVLSEGVARMRPLEMAMSVSAPMLRETHQPKPKPVFRSQWEHLTLAPDVELHVRRPGTREDNRRIERLLEAAREIFNEDLP